MRTGVRDSNLVRGRLACNLMLVALAAATHVRPWLRVAWDSRLLVVASSLAVPTLSVVRPRSVAWDPRDTLACSAAQLRGHAQSCIKRPQSSHSPVVQRRNGNVVSE